MITTSWTDVIDTTTGRIYASCEEVERRHGVPAEIIRACIQTGKSINGHYFECVTRRTVGPPRVNHADLPDKAIRKRRQRATSKQRRVDPSCPPLTDELKAQCVERYEAGVPMVDIGRAIGRQIGRRELKRWAAELKRKRSGNSSESAVDGPEGAENGSSSPA